MTVTSTVTATTGASADLCFAVLSDLSGYGAWLPRSAAYRGTGPDTGPSHAAMQGDRYVDRTPLGAVHGVVTDVEPGRRIGFRQGLSDRSLQIDIDYRLSASPLGTTIRRTGRITTRGRLRPIGPLVTRLILRENRRTMRHLATHLDSLPNGRNASMSATTTSSLTPHLDTDRLRRLAARVIVADPTSTQDVTNAMTGEVLGVVPRSTPADVVAAAARARGAQTVWAARPVADRAKVLLRFHDLVLERQDEALDLIQLENGKARRHAFEEIMDAALNARYYANTAPEYLRPKKRQGVQPGLTRCGSCTTPRGSSASSRRGTTH